MTLRCVIDCDPGVDDAMALWYGLLHPEIEVVAITTVWGNVSVETTTTNALRILELAGQTAIPVARGAARPLLGPEPSFSGVVHGRDGQGNTNLPPPKLRQSDEPAAELLVRLAHEQPGELTLVPVGPMTNVGAALALDPGIAGLYREVVLMGGSYAVPGNSARWGEANIWHDPEAAQMLFEASWPIWAVGLDVTHKARLSEAQLEELGACGTKAGEHLHRISQHYLELYARRWGRRECSMHDALALAIAHDRELVREAPKTRVDVELNGSHTRGMTVAELRPGRTGGEDANAHVVLEVDQPRFLDRWLATICQR
jgi:purine nucleosidase